MTECEKFEELTRNYGKMTEAKLRKYYYEKAFIQGEVLRIMIVANLDGEKSMSLSEINHNLCNRMTKSIYWNTSASLINLFIAELTWKELLRSEAKCYGEENNLQIELSLTEEGCRVYKNGTIESISAALLFAKSTNRLSMIAILISVLALIISIILQ